MSPSASAIACDYHKNTLNTHTHRRPRGTYIIWPINIIEFGESVRASFSSVYHHQATHVRNANLSLIFAVYDCVVIIFPNGIFTCVGWEWWVVMATVGCVIVAGRRLMLHESCNLKRTFLFLCYSLGHTRLLASRHTAILTDKKKQKRKEQIPYIYIYIGRWKQKKRNVLSAMNQFLNKHAGILFALSICAAAAHSFLWHLYTYLANSVVLTR